MRKDKRESTTSSPSWQTTSLGLVLLALVLFGGSIAECAEVERFNINLSVSLTGEVRTITWCNPTGQSTSNWEHTIEVVEFPPEPGQVASARAMFQGATTSWDYVPTRAGLFYVRARSCNTDTLECSVWGDSANQLNDDDGCRVAGDFVMYFKLAAPTGGGIE